MRFIIIITTIIIILLFDLGNLILKFLSINLVDDNAKSLGISEYKLLNNITKN